MQPDRDKLIWLEQPIPKGKRAIKIILLVSAVAAIGALIVAAQHRGSATRIAFIPRTTGSTLWEAEHAGATAAALTRRCEIYWNGPTHEDDVEDQIALVDRVRRGRFDGLVLAPDHSLALLTPVQRAVSAGIPVVIVSSDLALAPGPNLSYIVNDDQEAGRMAARRIAAVLNGSGRLAILGLDPNVTGVLTRLRAFESYLQRSYPRMEIVSRGPGAFNAAEAQQATLTALSSRPQLDALVGLTSVSTRAAYFTLRDTGLSNKIKLIGFEQDSDMTDCVKQGRIDSIVAEDTYNMGFAAVRELTDRKLGKQLPARVVLAPVLVTKDNADSPQVKRLIDMVWFHEH